MNEDKFWELIDRSQSGLTNPNDIVKQAKVLIELLKEQPSAEIIEFQKFFLRKRAACYSWRIWAVPYMAFEGCSDDAFGSFTAWMISKGKKLFNTMLNDSSVLVSEVKKTLPDWTCIGESEEFFLAPANAYNLKTRRDLTEDMPADAWIEIRACLDNPRGEQFSNSTICKLYPEICSHFAVDWLRNQ